jgi:hypothetical protein
MLREIKIADIRVGQRHRRDMGDLAGLAESIHQEGLLQPIGVTDRLELVFGERRILAVRDVLKRQRELPQDCREADRGLRPVQVSACPPEGVGVKRSERQV